MICLLGVSLTIFPILGVKSPENPNFVVTCTIATDFRVALPWELLYADDLAVIAGTEEELIKRLNEWKDNVESKGIIVKNLTV